MRPRGNELSRLFQDHRLRALRERIERFDRRRNEAVAPLARRLNAERRNERCLIAASVLARALAERQFVGLDIEDIVGHLKGRAKRVAEGREGGSLWGSRLPKDCPCLYGIMQKRAGFHRLKFYHCSGLMRLARFFGFEIEDLPPDHASQPSRARQSENEFHANRRVLMGRWVRHDIKRVSQKAVADKDRGCLAEGLVRGWPSPPQIVIVEGWKVVMDERIAMNYFDRRGGAGNAVILYAEKPRRLNREKRPEPLAAAEAGVTHGFKKSRRPYGLARQNRRREQGLEHALRRIGGFQQPGLEFACPRASRHCPAVPPL